jgi:hypothetical protein
MVTPRTITPSSITPPQWCDGLQTFFYLSPMSIRTNGCVGSSSATPVSLSTADDHHQHTNSQYPPLVTLPSPILGEAI